jgi:hypothetical protein
MIDMLYYVLLQSRQLELDKKLKLMIKEFELEKK